MRLFTEFEAHVVRDMIKLGLDPHDKEDIKKFWEYKLPVDKDLLDAS